MLRKKDPETGKPLVDLVLDKAGQKGTGKWTVQVSLDLGIPVPSIASALDARNLSAHQGGARGGQPQAPRAAAVAHGRGEGEPRVLGA